MRLITEIKLDFKDVLICPKRSTLNSRSEVDINRTFTFLHSGNSWTGVPIMAANMDTTGTFKVASALCPLKFIVCIDKHHTPEQWIAFKKSHPDLLPFTAVSTGIKERDYQSLLQVLSAVDPGFINIDVANGYTERFNSFVKKVRDRFPRKNIIAGNVVTGEMVEELLLSGADIVKIGIGPGSVCTTRVKTGVGYPQLSAVIECADAAHGLQGMIISDGGCVCAGDVVKAFGAGADFVMLGGMLAAHDECAGRRVERNGRKFQSFHGMSSAAAAKRHCSGRTNYRAWEGKEILMPERGPIAETAKDLLGGIRSACTMVGAVALKELSKRTTFVRVSQQENRVYSGEGYRLE